MESQPPVVSQNGLTVAISGKMLFTKDSAVNITFGGKAQITGKPKGDRNTVIIGLES
jgi:hypothetical protein